MKHRAIVGGLWACALGLLLGACGEDERVGASTVCHPGDTRPCFGVGACVGGQFCAFDGRTWSACECGGSGGSAGTAGSSSTGGSTSTGGAAGSAGSGGSTSSGGSSGSSSGGAGGASGTGASGGTTSTGGVGGATFDGGDASGGASGSGGATASGGTGGQAGSAATGGTGGQAGSAATGGTAGSTVDAGSDAPTWPQPGPNDDPCPPAIDLNCSDQCGPKDAWCAAAECTDPPWTTVNITSVADIPHVVRLPASPPKQCACSAKPPSEYNEYMLRIPVRINVSPAPTLKVTVGAPWYLSKLTGITPAADAVFYCPCTGFGFPCVYPGPYTECQILNSVGKVDIFVFTMDAASTPARNMTIEVVPTGTTCSGG